jgi:NAD(P)-dependent dehydrogenase (short-subunit alcohol dehydrogenase family)
MTSAVVTGASGGVGSAVAAALAEAGYRVFGLDVAEPPLNHSWEHLEIDLGDTAALNETIRLLPIDVGVIVHAAADQPLIEAQASDEEAWLRAWKVNVMSLQILVAEMFSVLSSNEPRRVITVGSVHSRHTSKRIAPYAVSKAAIQAYVRSLAIDSAPARVVAIDIELGAINSPKLYEGLEGTADPAAALADLIGRLPVGKLVAREDVASLTRWLLEPAADHLTGGSVELSGGIHAVLASEWSVSREP